MSGKNKKHKSTRTSSTKENSSKQLQSKKVADNGENLVESVGHHNNSEKISGNPVTPARQYQGNSNHTNTNTLVSNPAPPVQSVVNVPHTPTGTEELSTLATLPHQDLPSSETVKQFTTMHVFPLVKFYTKGTTDTLLDWKREENSMCQFVLKGCNVPMNKRRDYWPVAANLVHRKLTILRNDRPICVRKAFFGK